MLLQQGNYLVYNKELGKLIGVYETVILSYVLELSDFRSKIEKEDWDGWFICQRHLIEEETSIKRTAQTTALNKLISLGLIQSKNCGLPRRQNLRVCSDFDHKFDLIITTNKDNDDSSKSPESPECGNQHHYKSKSTQPDVEINLLGSGNQHNLMLKSTPPDVEINTTTSRNQHNNITNTITETITNIAETSSVPVSDSIKNSNSSSKPSKEEKWNPEQYATQCFQNPELQVLYVEYLKIRKMKKYPITKFIIDKQHTDISKCSGLEQAVELITRAITNGWQGMNVEWLKSTINTGSKAYISNR
jgi:hypothetical protein